MNLMNRLMLLFELLQLFDFGRRLPKDRSDENRSRSLQNAIYAVPCPPIDPAAVWSDFPLDPGGYLQNYQVLDDLS